MPMQRMTAVKVRIKDITQGEWVKTEGMVPSYVITPYGEQIARARILGTVVTKFVSEDSGYATLTIDDSTDTIRLKTFKSTEPVVGIEIGDLVDVVGKVREYNGEVYVVPEIIRKITDIRWEIIRKMEILSKIEKLGIKPAAQKDKNPRLEILKLIEERKEGIEFSEILKIIKAPEKEIEDAINSLLSEGLCYESRPGIIRKI